MIKFINGYRMADQLEEDVQEIKDLLDKGLIKRTQKHEPSFIVSDENLKEVESALNKYKENGYLEILTPKEFASDCYATGGYDMEVQLHFSHVGIELSEALDNIECESEVFTETEMMKVYNAENIEKSFRELLDTITRNALKEKISKMSELVDNVSLWRVGRD